MADYKLDGLKPVLENEKFALSHVVALMVNGYIQKVH